MSMADHPSMSGRSTRRQYAVTVWVDVDAEGADLLPGWPGSVSPLDPTDVDPPIPGIELALDSCIDRMMEVIKERLSSVTDVRFAGGKVEPLPESKPTDWF